MWNSCNKTWDHISLSYHSLKWQIMISDSPFHHNIHNDAISIHVITLFDYFNYIFTHTTILYTLNHLFKHVIYYIIQEVRKNVICYIRPVVGWYNLGININEKLKGVVKKDKKIEYSKYKNPSCEAKNYSRFYFLLSATSNKIEIFTRARTQPRRSHSHIGSIYDVQCIQCCVYWRYQLAILN